MSFVLLVVRVELLVARHHASVKRMRLLARHFDHNGLLHAVGDDLSHHFFAPPLHLLDRRGCRFPGYAFRHYRFSDAAERLRSPEIVLIRAMSLRRPRIFFRLSFWPMFS